MPTKCGSTSSWSPRSGRQKARRQRCGEVGLRRLTAEVCCVELPTRQPESKSLGLKRQVTPFRVPKPLIRNTDDDPLQIQLVAQFLCI